MFVPATSIDWIWYDRPHYLTPNDDVSEEAFSVIRDAMATTGTVGISRLVLYHRERAVMLENAILALLTRMDTGDGTLRVPSDYLEVIVTKR